MLLIRFLDAFDFDILFLTFLFYKNKSYKINIYNLTETQLLKYYKFEVVVTSSDFSNFSNSLINISNSLCY